MYSELGKEIPKTEGTSSNGGLLKQKEPSITEALNPLEERGGATGKWRAGRPPAGWAVAGGRV